MKRIRVLHVVGGLNAGGLETWLLHAARRIDRAVQMDFAVQHTSSNEYVEDFRQLGSVIVTCANPRMPWKFAAALIRCLQARKYDVVHSHVHHYSGFVLALAALCGVPIRIAHSHSDTRSEDLGAGLLRRGYYYSSKRLIDLFATRCLAVSSNAAAALFGPGWRVNPRVRILHCGLDLAPYRRNYDREAARAELGIPKDALVVGHVGRFVPAKNHVFLLDVIAELARMEPRAYAMLVGDGPLKTEMVARSHCLGLGGRVVFAGVRRDIPRLMRGAMDAMVFPSVYEGLPLTLVEAQAAGLRALVSDRVSRETQECESIEWLSLSAAPVEWARQLRRLIEKPRPAPLATSQFDIDTCLHGLSRIYAGEES